MEWKVKIIGEESYLKEICEFFSIFKKLNESPVFYIYQDNNGYFLKSKKFKNVDNPKEVIEIAEYFLTLLPMFFKSTRDTPHLEIVEIIKQISNSLDEYERYDSKGRFLSSKRVKDGKPVYSYTGSVKACISLKDEISITLNGKVVHLDMSINSLNKKLKELINNKEEELTSFVEYLKHRLELISNFTRLTKREEVRKVLSEYREREKDIITLQWVKLYNVFQVILNEVRQEIKQESKDDPCEVLEQRGYGKCEDFVNFIDNANYYYRHPTETINKIKEVSSSKSKKDKKEPPQKPMSLEHAQSLIENLIIRWCKDKLKHLQDKNK